MSFEGTGGALDAIPEVQEISEIGLEPNNVFTEPEFTELSETGSEDIEKLLSDEGNKAEYVLQLTGDAIKTASDVTDPNLFVEEENTLRDLENKLKNVSSETVVETRYTEEDKANAIRFGNTSFEQLSESVKTITPEENKEDFKALINHVEIPVRNKEEKDFIDKASDVITHNKIESLTPTEAHNIITNLESIGTRELPGDKWYNTATNLLERQASYNTLQRPFTIRHGEGDDKIGEVAIIPSIKEKFSEKDPKLSLKEVHDLEVSLEKNPRAKLEEMIYKLRKYENKKNPNN